MSKQLSATYTLKNGQTFKTTVSDGREFSFTSFTSATMHRILVGNTLVFFQGDQVASLVVTQ